MMHVLLTTTNVEKRDMSTKTTTLKKGFTKRLGKTVITKNVK